MDSAVESISKCATRFLVKLRKHSWTMTTPGIRRKWRKYWSIDGCSVGNVIRSRVSLHQDNQSDCSYFPVHVITTTFITSYSHLISNLFINASISKWEHFLNSLLRISQGEKCHKGNSTTWFGHLSAHLYQMRHETPFIVKPLSPPPPPASSGACQFPSPGEPCFLFGPSNRNSCWSQSDTVRCTVDLLCRWEFLQGDFDKAQINSANTVCTVHNDRWSSRPLNQQSLYQNVRKPQHTWSTSYPEYTESYEITLISNFRPDFPW